MFIRDPSHPTLRHVPAVPELTPFTEYAVRLRAYSSAGPSDWSAVAMLATLPAAPMAPTALGAEGGPGGLLALQSHASA